MPRRQKHLPKPHDVRVRRAQPVVEHFSQRRPRHAGPPLQKLDGHLGVGGAVQGEVDEAKGALGREGGRGVCVCVSRKAKNGGGSAPPGRTGRKTRAGMKSRGGGGRKRPPQPLHHPPPPSPRLPTPGASWRRSPPARVGGQRGRGRSRRGAGRAPDFFGGGARPTKKGSRRPPTFAAPPLALSAPPPPPRPAPPPCPHLIQRPQLDVARVARQRVHWGEAFFFSPVKSPLSAPGGYVQMDALSLVRARTPARCAQHTRGRGARGRGEGGGGGAPKKSQREKRGVARQRSATANPTPFFYFLSLSPPPAHAGRQSSFGRWV